MKDIEFFTLKGHTLLEYHEPDTDGKCSIVTNIGRYGFNHSQGCCERVIFVRLEGDINKLIGKTITLAEEDITDMGDEPNVESGTRTKFSLMCEGTEKVTLIFEGESNGYYGEEVDFVEVN